jgi:hypothetical protein
MHTLILFALLFLFLVAMPAAIIFQIWRSEKYKLHNFRNNLQPKQTIKVDLNNHIREARVKKATKSLVYVILATSEDVCVPTEDVYPMNYFQEEDENTSFEVNNIKVA